jgi:hypothetical protein
MSEPLRPSDDGPDLHTEDVARAYRMAAREEPTPELDAAIQAAAVRAVGSRARPRRRRSPRWWGVPIAVAATIVIGVSIAFLASEQSGSPLTTLPEAPPAPTHEPRQMSPARPISRNDTNVAPPTVRQDEGPAAPDTSERATATRDVRPTRERTPRDLTASRREAPSAAPAPADGERTATGEAPGNAQAQPSGSAAAPPTAKAMRKDMPAPATAPPVTDETEPLSPEVWLQRVRELRMKGDVAQADANLRAFRLRYPDYPLPADLSPPAHAGN